MKFANETHKRIIGDIHEEVIRRIDSHDSSIRSTYEEGWMNAMSLAEDIINKWFTAQSKAEETDSSTADVPAPQAPSTPQPKIKGIVVLVRGKPIYRPIWRNAVGVDDGLTRRKKPLFERLVFPYLHQRCVGTPQD